MALYGQRSGRNRQAGLSIVELMVGVAVGLLVVAAATMLTATQLFENRKMMLETQIQQDLRASADIITRELRRAGAWRQAEGSVWVPTPGINTQPKAADFSVLAPMNAAAGQVDYVYDRDIAGGARPQTGFRLDATAQRIQTLLALPNTWQSLTDENTLKVDPTAGFVVTPRHVTEPTPPVVGAPQKMPCPKLCPGGTMDCWPTMQVREFTIDIEGTAVDPTVRRAVRSIIRLRNDEIVIDPAGVCPV